MFVPEMGIRNTIHLKEDICSGPGKFAVQQANQNNHTHIAIVHPSSLELMVLDQKGNVLKQDILELDELIIDKPDDVQVLWCEPEPKLIVAHTNHLLRLAFDCPTQSWKADINRIMLEQQEWINSLAFANGNLYTASKEGMWEVDGTDLQPRSQLCDFTVTVMCVSDIYLTAGDEEGAISLFQSGPNGWSQSQRTRQPTDKSCCTCMLIIPEKAQMVLLAGFSSGYVRLYSLPTMECLSETPAHIRWITSILPMKGGFISAAEDGFIHVWMVGKSDDPGWNLRYMTSIEMKDLAITSAAPFTEWGILITAYDRRDIHWLTVSGRQEEEEDEPEVEEQSSSAVVVA